MKLRLAVFLLAAGAFLLFFSGRPAESGKPAPGDSLKERSFSELRAKKVYARAFGISPRVGSLKPAGPRADERSNKLGRAERQALEIPNRQPFRKQMPGATADRDAARAVFSPLPMPTPLLSFEGLSSNDNAAAYGFRVVPPDTIGDVGPDHYVQAVNLLFRVFDKEGRALTPPLKMSSLFEPLGTVCAARNDGDPIVLYDELADRWIFSQFCKNAPPFRQMIAVSRTGDPLGEYHVYEFVMPNIKLNDYPKLGVWRDAYYMSTDEFFGGDYAGSGAFAFERRKMLEGDPSASYLYFDLASPSTFRLGGILPADLDGLNPPPEGSPGIFAGYTATEYGDPADAIRLFGFRADFAEPANSFFAELPGSPVPVAAFDPTSPPGRDDIEQPPPGEDLDSQSDRLMYRLAYRNLGTHESLVVNQTVRLSPVGPYTAGVRVHELRRTAPGEGFQVGEQATVGAGDASRFMAAAAQDRDGNIAVGYSTSGDEKPPSVFYTGRLAPEPPGVFRRETPLVTGTGVQTAFGFRWGDYTGLSVDPADGCTFWITNQYYTMSSQNESPFGWLTRIGAFRFEECVPSAAPVFIGTVLDDDDGTPLAGASVEAGGVYTRRTDGDGTFGSLRVAPGTYEIKAAKRGYRPETVVRTVAPGETVSLTLRLEPVAVPENPEPPGITAESCAVNGTAEPSERVTVGIPLRNTGARETAGLTAELLPGEGVKDPSGPQKYGILTTAGETVSRFFSFTVAPGTKCGEEIGLSLRLRDGGEELGVLRIPLRTGRLKTVLTENFDAVAAPDLPAGWSSSFEGRRAPWETSDARAESAPNAAFSAAPRTIGVSQLVSPPVPIGSTEARLSFRNWYELETTFLRNRVYDGAVLEIKIGDEDWEDILEAGGVFLSGGYDEGVIDGCCSNPLAGRRAWSGRSGTDATPVFVDSVVALPSKAAGREVRFRWRVATDNGTFREGQYIDDVVVTDGYVCDCAGPAAAPAPFDFDGDGRTDPSVFRPSADPQAADFYIRRSSDGADEFLSWGSPGDLAVNADYDGDGRTDLAVLRPGSRTWFVLNSSDDLYTATAFGLAGDRPTPADYDGDGRADHAVYRPSEGKWYVLQSSDGNVNIERFGLPDDLPVPEDYDGDGRADRALYRPSEGKWYVRRSSDGNVAIERFGLAGDRPVVGDRDGDGRADLVLYRPSEGVWYLLGSTGGFSAVRFGIAGDAPLQADFDGDGKRDIAVFRPTEGVWYYLRSSDGGFVRLAYGTNGDTAVPSVFVPE